jgi:hypothetical protein
MVSPSLFCRVRAESVRGVGMCATISELKEMLVIDDSEEACQCTLASWSENHIS